VFSAKGPERHADKILARTFQSVCDVLWDGEPRNQGFIHSGSKRFSLLHGVHATLGPTHYSIQWVLIAFTPGVKWLGYEFNHSPTSTAEVKNAWSYTSTLPYFLWPGA
jgi:hypothetical protein